MFWHHKKEEEEVDEETGCLSSFRSRGGEGVVGGEGRSKDAGEGEDVSARELEEEIVSRMSVLGAMLSVSCAALGLEGVVDDEDAFSSLGFGGQGRSKDAGENVDVSAREPEEVIVLRMSVLDAMFSVSCAALGWEGVVGD